MTTVSTAPANPLDEEFSVEALVEAQLPPPSQQTQQVIVVSPLVVACMGIVSMKSFKKTS